MIARRQLRTLVANAVRLDLRPRSASGEGRWTRIAPLAVNLAFHFLTGFAIAQVTRDAGLPLATSALFVYLVSGTLVFMHLVAESDQLTAPLDGDILYWRPIAARTLFAARALHILVYVLVLSSVQLLLPSLLLAWDAPRAGLTFGTLFAAGTLHVVWVTAVAILLHGAILRRLAAEKLHAVLTAFQLAFAVLFMAGSQLLAPQLLATAGSPHERGWAWLLPPAWFAAWPALVREGGSALQSARAALGVVALGAGVAFALARLAPRYEAAVVRLRDAEGRVARRNWIGRALDDTATRVGGLPLRRAGFEFLLAQLRGDRRTRESLWTLMGIPLGILVAAVVAGGAGDPYRFAGDGAGAVAWGAENGPRLLFTSTYLVAWTMLGLGRSLGRSAHWRGAWVFHAAPIRRYDEFCLGIGFAVAIATLLPVFALQAAVLLSAWRDPLHVVMHLAPPLGLALVALAAAPLIGFAPPFTREVARLERGADFVLMLAAMLPITALAFVHWSFRDRIWMPLAGGAALVAVAPLMWALSRRRIRNCFRNRVFSA